MIVAFVCDGNHQLEQPESRLEGDNILGGMRESWAKNHWTSGDDDHRSSDEDHDAHYLAACKHKVEYCQRSKVELGMNYWNRDIHQKSGLNCWDARGALDVGH